MPQRRFSLLRVLSLFLLCALCVKSFSSSSLHAVQLPRAADVVTPEIYVSLAPAPRGRTVEIAVVAHIRSGFHTNSNKPGVDYLIPTTLTADLRQGITLADSVYPPGVMRKFKFTQKELSVYEGTVTMRLKLEVAANAPLGPQKIPLTLRYQACNDEACLPPVKIPLSADLEIASAGAQAVPQHPEIFVALPSHNAPAKN
jgi:DsbC/DsbD-like thiol-disulfide interchange protein